MHSSIETIDKSEATPGLALARDERRSLPEPDDTFGRVIRNLQRLRHKLAGGESGSAPVVGLSLTDQIDACSSLISEIDTTADDTRQQLAHAEWLNHELQLQLHARSSESNKDALTGLANRRSFDREFGERCLTAQNTQCPLLLVILDIDHFKSVNDTRGHHVGDAVLRGLANVLKELVPPGSLVARHGGEEFAIVLSGICIDNAIDLVEQLRSHISRTQFRYEGQSLAVTISCGLAQLHAQDHSEHLLQRSDSALYASKQSGRNRTSWHDGQALHQVTPDGRSDSANLRAGQPAPSGVVINLEAAEGWQKSAPADVGMHSSTVTTPRTTRANWCDGSMLFWYVRQRLAEWKRGGEPLCVLAIDVDHGRRIAQSYGLVALHFMMRTQMLHLDTTLRDTDIVARTSHSRVIVVLPRSTVASLTPLLKRLHDTMDRFAYPVAEGILDYSISLGIAESTMQDDAQQFVLRAEAALTEAQLNGKRQFYVHNLQQSRPLELAPPTTTL